MVVHARRQQKVQNENEPNNYQTSKKISIDPKTWIKLGHFHLLLEEYKKGMRLLFLIVCSAISLRFNLFCSSVSVPNVLQDRKGKPLERPVLFVWTRSSVFSFQRFPMVSLKLSFIFFNRCVLTYLQM